MKRRDLLKAAAAWPLVGCSGHSAPPLPPGELLGPNYAVGHRLRGQGFPPATEEVSVPVLIIGAGIAGLSAAWWLQRNGFHDFRLLELETEAGGNARGGANAISAYPWGAHYLPLPSREAVHVRELLADLGVLSGDPQAEKPLFDERYLCQAPQERLYFQGQWQEGLMPGGVSASERSQQQRFDQRMREFAGAVGRDGRRAFVIPMDLSSRDPRFLSLDQGSFRDWLLRAGFTAPTVHWLANYACRDDYGTDYRNTSAWAGVHYFACRNGQAANADADVMLTWPEGNAWLARRMAGLLGAQLHPGHCAWAMTEVGQQVLVDTWLPAEQRSRRYIAEQVIWAGPMFQLPHLWRNAPTELSPAVAGYSYAPWLVANLSLAGWPQEKPGVPSSWENILYDSPALGYVVATHQHLAVTEPQTVFTWYQALSQQVPGVARQQLLQRGQPYWAEQILADLEPVHGDIRQQCTRLDVWRWGHAMSRPTPGQIWGPERAWLGAEHGRIHLAHADLSGFSLFEEANYWGVQAACRVLRCV